MPKLKQHDLKAGRKHGYKHTQAVRDKIQATALVKRLNDIALGNVEADSTQVNAAKALLNKVLPDLKAVEHTGELDHTHTINPIEELMNAIDGKTRTK